MTIFDHNHPKFIKVIFNFPEFASACKKLAQSIHLFLIIHIHTTDFRFSWLKSGHRHFWPCPPNNYWVVINHALTHTHQHPAKNRPHSPTPTHTHTHPAKKKVTPTASQRRSYPPTASQKKVRPTHTCPQPARKGHTHPHSATKGQKYPQKRISQMG